VVYVALQVLLCRVFQIECLIFEAEQQGIRALFKHGSFELAERLLHFIACQQEAMTLA